MRTDIGVAVLKQGDITIPEAVRLLAEEQSVDYAPWPGSELVRGDGFEVWFGPPYYPDLSVVRRFRLIDSGVEDGLRGARDIVRSRGRNRASWSVASSATPGDLADRLASFGLVPGDDPVLKATVLRREPDDVPSDIVVRRATTIEDYRDFFRIQQAAFETDPDLVERGAPFIDEVYDAEMSADHIATYLAYVDGEAVATARATFTDIGVVLNGGSTLHRARGKGAYRALVVARWNDAVARGTPCLTTLARPTSYPILKRMGFEDVGDVRMFDDHF